MVSYQLKKIFVVCVIFLISQPIIASNEDILQKIDAKKLFGKNVTEIKSESNSEIIFLDFWASWCGACKQNLEKLSQLPEVKQNENLRKKIFLVSLDESKEDAKSFFTLDETSKDLKKLKTRAYITTLGESELAEMFPKLDAIPFFVVYDRKKNKILWSHAGTFSNTDLTKIKDFLKRK